MKGCSWIVAVLIVLFAVGGPAESLRYEARDMGPFFGGLIATPTAINNKGQVVGGAAMGPGMGPTHAFLWSDGNVLDLGTDMEQSLSGNATGINEHGAVVGSLSTGGDGCTAFLWQDGQSQDLGVLPGRLRSGAVGVNNQGQVIGQCDYLSSFLWSAGSMQELAGFYARSINDAGQIAGEALDLDRHRYGCVWENGSLRALPGGEGASIRQINDRGQVIGKTSSTLLWDADGTVHDLGCQSPWRTSPMGINELGQVVGSYLPPGSGNGLACIWDNGLMYDLNTLVPADLGWALSCAYAVNDLGQIAATARRGDTFTAFLLTPVPEPSSLLALAFGLAGIGGVIRRRRSA